MTISLDSTLIRAAEHSPNWNLECFRRALQALENQSIGQTCDWDSGAGEEWGRVMVGQRQVGMIGVSIPLLCAVPGVIADFTRMWHSTRDQPVCYAVEDLESPIFSVNQDTLKLLFPRREISTNFDSTAFSILDFWWATV